MTEAEWLTTTDSVRLVCGLRSSSDRKLRLLGCAFCRLIWSQLSRLGQRAVEVAERYADGLEAKRTLVTYRVRLNALGGRDCTNLPFSLPSCAVSECGWYAAELNVGSSLDRSQEASIVRDIFGNPFRPITVDPSWLAWKDRTIVKLAQSIYDNRAFDRMPILADALEDAGCHDADILAHCRSEGPHVRGCWVIDLLLSKDR
jgi:hypothetical protein